MKALGEGRTAPSACEARRRVARSSASSCAARARVLNSDHQYPCPCDFQQCAGYIPFVDVQPSANAHANTDYQTDDIESLGTAA